MKWNNIYRARHPAPGEFGRRREEKFLKISKLSSLWERKKKKLRTENSSPQNNAKKIIIIRAKLSEEWRQKFLIEPKTFFLFILYFFRFLRVIIPSRTSKLATTRTMAKSQLCRASTLDGIVSSSNFSPWRWQQQIQHRKWKSWNSVSTFMDHNNRSSVWSTSSSNTQQTIRHSVRLRYKGADFLLNLSQLHSPLWLRLNPPQWLSSPHSSCCFSFFHHFHFHHHRRRRVNKKQWL